MQSLLIPLLLAGCETMEPSGEPFSPVQTTPAATAPVEVARDPAFDFDEFEMSSEELHAAAGDVQPDGPTETAVADTTSDEPQVADATPADPPPEVAPAAAEPTRVLTVSSQQPAWPVRLVRTLPETQPPRAILGMPDGREIVVKPGTMVPEQGLVVISIGRGQIELARITAVGDHATVASQTITSQY